MSFYERTFGPQARATQVAAVCMQLSQCKDHALLAYKTPKSKARARDSQYGPTGAKDSRVVHKQPAQAGKAARETAA